MQYETIFFDLDHTLWDFEKNSHEALTELVYKHKLIEKGVSSLDSFISEYFAINELLWEEYRKGAISKESLRYERFFRTLKKYEIEDLHLAKRFGEDYVSISPYKTHLFPHSVDILNYLNEKYSLHIITNGFEEVQHLKLKNCKLDHYFTEVITSERSGYKKPDERMFHFSLEATGATPQKSLMIGDSLEADIVGAQNVGIDQVYFNPTENSHSTILTYEIKSLAELKNIL